MARDKAFFWLACAGALAFAGWSANELRLALGSPAPVAPDLALPVVPASEPEPEEVVAVVQPVAAIFGTPLPSEPEPEPEPDMPDPSWDEPDPDDLSDDAPLPDLEGFRLTGMLVDQTGALAILETPDGTLVVREGTILPTGEEVFLIDDDGVELLIDEELFLIEMEDRPATNERRSADRMSAGRPRGDRFDEDLRDVDIDDWGPEDDWEDDADWEDIEELD